jgi:hypothetical protein
VVLDLTFALRIRRDTEANIKSTTPVMREAFDIKARREMQRQKRCFEAIPN